MENTKLTVEEVEKLQDIQQKNAAVATELGNLEITKLQIEARREEVVKYYTELKQEENTFGKELRVRPALPCGVGDAIGGSRCAGDLCAHSDDP